MYEYCKIQTFGYVIDSNGQIVRDISIDKDGKVGKVDDFTGDFVAPFTSENLKLKNKRFYFYKHNKTQYNAKDTTEKDISLEEADQKQIKEVLKIAYLQSSIFKSIADQVNTNNQKDVVNFFNFPKNNMIVIDSNLINDYAIEFADTLATPYTSSCERYENCKINLGESSNCDQYKTDCTEYLSCNLQHPPIDGFNGFDLSCITEARNANMDFNIFNTKLQNLNNMIHVCLTLEKGVMEFCSRIDIFEQFQHLVTFQPNRFLFVYTDKNFNILYNNFNQFQFFENQSVESLILDLGQANAKDNYSSQTIEDQLAFIFQYNTEITSNVYPNQGIVNIDNSQSYDSVQLL